MCLGHFRFLLLFVRTSGISFTSADGTIHSAIGRSSLNEMKKNNDDSEFYSLRPRVEIHCL